MTENIELVEVWQSRYVGDPRQKGCWDNVRRDATDWAVKVYAMPDHTDEHGWEVRPLFADYRPAPVTGLGGQTADYEQGYADGRRDTRYFMLSEGYRIHSEPQDEENKR